jgi:mannosyltransferase
MKPRPVAATAGALLIAAALLISSASLERLFGRQPHSLAWGPALFRVLLALHGLWLIAYARGPAHVARNRAQRAPRTGAAGIPRMTLLALTALTVLALALRLPGLNSCMWLDEVLTMVNFARPPAAHIFTSFPDQNQHMLYSLLAHGSMRLFGEQVWALRLPSVLFGVASIWTLFLLGRRLTGEKEALLACGLATVSYHHIWFSQNARGYMGLLFFTNLATWLWLEAMDRDDWRTWTGYAASVALGLWIHMTMLFVVGAHFLIFLAVWLRSGREPARLKRAAAAFLLCGTLTLQVYALALPEFFRSAVSEISMPSEWTNPLWMIAESVRNLEIGFAALAVVLAGGFLVAAGWFDILRIQARAAWAMVLPALFGGAAMLAMGHNLWPRFFFFCMGFGLLIVVHGAVLLPRVVCALWPGLTPDSGWKAGYAMAGLMILASASTVPRCYALPKQDFTGARDYLSRQREAGDAVIAVGLAGHAYGEYYAPQWPVATTAAELSAIRQGHARTFVVYTLPIELKAFQPALWQAVEAGYEPVKVFYGSLGGGEVYVCREKGAGSGLAAGQARTLPGLRP